MGKRIFTIFLTLVVLLPFTACGGTNEDATELPSAQEIIDGAIKSADDIRSHKFDMDISIEATGEEEGETVEMMMSMAFSGAVDFENEEMNANISIGVEVTGEEGMEMMTAMYIIDGMGYVMMDMPGTDPVWMKEEVAEGEWEEASQMLIPVESHLELLEAADVRVAGSESVKGVECYVLELTPDLGRLWETVMQQIEVADMDMPYIAEQVLQEAFSSFSVKQWITKETYFLTKSEIVMSMEMTPEIIGMMGTESMANMDIMMTFLSYDHNKPISLEVPREALEAKGFFD